MATKIAPRYGKKNPMIYLSICSTVGSISVMATKAFGIAVKLTLGGNNQFTLPSTYVFVIVMAGCILTQMTYLNKALSQFSTNMYEDIDFMANLSTDFVFTASIHCTTSSLLLPRFWLLSSCSEVSTPLMLSTLFPYCADSWSFSREYICSTCLGTILMDRRC